MKTDYALMTAQLESLAGDVEYEVTNLANAAALLYESLDDINWAGFYLMRDGELVLGPFQGKVACTKIAVGRGVCGTAVERDRIQCVPDVHAFAGHIACDSASNSEIVIPIHKNGYVWGVLDIDSPKRERFSSEDEQGLEMFVRKLEKVLGL